MQNFWQQYWIYWPLVVAVFIGYLLYKKFVKKFKWKRMVQSVRQQKRVNLSPWTNFVLVIGVIIFVLLVLGMFWSGYGAKDTFLYGLGFFVVFLAIEFVRRQIRGESKDVIAKLFGVVFLFFLLNIAIHIGYQTPSQDYTQPTVDLYFSLSNDSFEGAPPIEGMADDQTVVKVSLLYNDEVYVLGNFSDKTRRDESYQNEDLEEYLKGTNDGWAHYSVDLTPYLSGEYFGQELKIVFENLDSVDCSNIKDISLILNKIKGIYAENYVQSEIDSHCYGTDGMEFQFIIN